MPEPTIDDIRAMMDPEGYVRALGEVLVNYKSHLGRLLADHDLQVEDETLNEEQREGALKQTRATMNTVVWRIRALEGRIEGVKGGRPMNRAGRRKRK